MKKLSLPFFLLLLFACGKNKNADNPDTAFIPNPPSTVVKVMTYNIHICNPPSKPAAYKDIPAIANAINLQQPDLVALQEVDVHTNRSGAGVDQAKEIARLTGMYCFFTKAIDYDGGQFGDAVLSRLPVADSIRYQLPVTAKYGGETRSVAMITVEKDGHKFNFASTHLDHTTPDDNRILQANSLVKIIADITNPLIIAGDLNALPTSQPLVILKQQLTWGCTGPCPVTFPQDTPVSTIDYILFKPASRFNVKYYTTVNETYASDHRPLISEIELK